MRTVKDAVEELREAVRQRNLLRLELGERTEELAAARRELEALRSRVSQLEGRG